MKKPKPIKLAGMPSNKVELEYVHRQYLYVTVTDGENIRAYGFIEDRDVVRLMRWCEDILSKRSKARKR